jgi:hypothetical protein
MLCYAWAEDLQLGPRQGTKWGLDKGQ